MFVSGVLCSSRWPLLIIFSPASTLLNSRQEDVLMSDAFRHWNLISDFKMKLLVAKHMKSFITANKTVEGGRLSR